VERNQVSAFWQSPIFVLSVVAWLSAPPASLGEAAEREAVRRRMMPKSVAVLTNLGLPREVPLIAAPPPGDPAITPPPAATPPQAAAPPAEPAKPAKDERDEKWWRARMAAARGAIERGQVMADALQSRINALQRDVVNMDDPAQQAKLRTDLGKALGELERTTKQIEADRKAVTDLQEEARRLNVPPGWLR
jgi:hypothetical protein